MKAEELRELQEMERRSEAFHAHPSHPSSCQRWEEHYGTRCPCETVKPEPESLK